MVYYCGAGLDFMFQFATVLLEACVQRLQAVPHPHDSISSPLEGWAGLVGWEELLDYLSVLLPAVRVVFDWFKCQRELCLEALTTVKQPIL